MKSTQSLLLLLIAVISVSESQICPSSKKARKAQEDLLTSLDEEDVVVGAKFDGKEGDKYRFTVTQIWTLHNGNLIPGVDILVAVTATHNTFTSACFEDLRIEDRYILILKPDSAGLFIPISPPVSIRKHNHKQNVWKQLCGLTDQACRLTISRVALPSEIVIYNKRNEFIRCQVNSRYRVTRIRWMKDGKDIDEEGGDFYAEYGVFVHKTNLRGGFSDLVIYDSHHINSGRYTCIAENENGETDQASTTVFVRSLSNPEANYVPCPLSEANFCLGKGVCKALRDAPSVMRCECKTGYTGVRCQDTAVSAFSLGAYAINNRELRGKVHGLTVAIIGLSIGLLFCIPVVAIFIFNKVRNSRKKSTQSISHNHSNDTQFSSLSNASANEKLAIAVDENAPLKSSNSVMKKEMVAKIVNGNSPDISITIPSIDVVTASPRPRLKAERS